jgi:hypothetical protein
VKFTTRAQPGVTESNAVPDHPLSLTDYERGLFRALPEPGRSGYSVAPKS